LLVKISHPNFSKVSRVVSAVFSIMAFESLAVHTCPCSFGGLRRCQSRGRPGKIWRALRCCPPALPDVSPQVLGFWNSVDYIQAPAARMLSVFSLSVVSSPSSRGTSRGVIHYSAMSSGKPISRGTQALWDENLRADMPSTCSRNGQHQVTLSSTKMETCESREATGERVVNIGRCKTPRSGAQSSATPKAQG
jgi:hypothetical protein